MTTDKITYWEIFSVVLLRLAPALVLVALGYKAARRHILAIAALPATVADNLYLLLVFAIAYLIAGKLIVRLRRHDSPGSSEPEDGSG